MVERSLRSAMNAKIIGSVRRDETLILGHGYGGDQSVWDQIIPYFSKHYKILVFDWDFSGQDLFDPEKQSSYSYCYDGFANDLISLIDEMNLNMSSSVFIGHSMAGMIGCLASIQRPQLFNKLILVGASPRYINIDNYQGGFNQLEIESMMETIESNFDGWTANFASLVVGAHDPISVNKFSTSLKRMKPSVALAVAKTVFYSDHRHILDKVLTPCTIIQTTADAAVPNSVAYYIHENIKADSTVEIIDIVGHFPHLTAHQQLVQVLTRVLDIYN